MQKPTVQVNVQDNVQDSPKRKAFLRLRPAKIG